MIHLKLIIMALLWAGGFVAGKVIATQAGPFTISFLRFFAATVILAVLVNQKERYPKISLALLGHALWAAFLGIFCYNYLFFSGIKLVEAARGSVIISTVPVVVAVISFALFKEKMSILKTLGIIFSVLGAWVVVSKGNTGVILGDIVGRGEIYLVICVFCAAAFTVSSKKLLQSLSPMVTVVYISMIGTAFLFAPALLEMSQTSVDFGSYKFLLNLIYLAVGPSVIALIFYYEAINTVGMSRATQYMNLMPVFAVVLAFIFLGEQLTGSLIVGGGLVTTGLYLTNFNA